MNADETQVDNTYLGFFTIFSSFLCSASLEKKDKSFRGHFPGSCVPYFHIFWPKRNIERGWGTGGKNRTCPPPHTHTHTLASGIFIRDTSLLWLQLSSRACDPCSLLSVLDDHAFCYCFFQVVFLYTGYFLIFFIYLTRLNSLYITQ